jgi:hypothetical protein
VRGRSLESKGWSFESSQRAKRVSIRSNISSLSASEFPSGVADDSAISFLLVFLTIKSRWRKERGVV